MNKEKIDGNWITGFTDGEGCFIAGVTRQEKYKNASINFQITLREDDSKVIYRIKNYFGCGTLNRYEPAKYVNSDSKYVSKPVLMFQISSIKKSYLYIIPHFIKFPLQSKKAKDFIIWKEIVELCYHKQHLENWTYYEYLCRKLKNIKQFVPQILKEFILQKNNQLDVEAK